MESILRNNQRLTAPQKFIQLKCEDQNYNQGSITKSLRMLKMKEKPTNAR